MVGHDPTIELIGQKFEWRVAAEAAISFELSCVTRSPEYHSPMTTQDRRSYSQPHEALLSVCPEEKLPFQRAAFGPRVSTAVFAVVGFCASSAVLYPQLSLQWPTIIPPLPRRWTNGPGLIKKDKCNPPGHPVRSSVHVLALQLTGLSKYCFKSPNEQLLIYGAVRSFTISGSLYLGMHGLIFNTSI